MNWRGFLKPNCKKIFLFILLYVLIPYPLGLWELPSGMESLGLRQYFLFFFSPLVLKDSIIEIFKYGLEPYINVYWALLSLGLPFIWPIIIYLLSCWIISPREGKLKIF